MNILILAAGTRNKIVQYFKKALNGRGIVVAADASPLGPAIYEADKYYIVHSITDPGYIDEILDICKIEHISGVISLIDPELSLLAENSKRFKEVGARVIGSSAELCNLALDKFRMYEWLVAHGYRCARSWMDRESFFRALDNGEVSFPVIVKPAKGSASINVVKAEDRRAVELLTDYADGLMIQEYLNGSEIGADVYVDMISGKTVSIFTKRKLKMRAGETDKAVSFKDKKLFSLIERFMSDTGYVAQVDIDIFEIDGEYYISEVNPRFGGGYPHAYESGCDHIKLILNNIQGIENSSDIGSYDEGIYMMKYNEVMIKRI